eukprot:12909495-Prorocentrum_lima.AAC.1
MKSSNYGTRFASHTLRLSPPHPDGECMRKWANIKARLDRYGRGPWSQSPRANAKKRHAPCFRQPHA